MSKYKGFTSDQYGSVFDEDGDCVGKLDGETLKAWVDDYFEGLALGIYN